MTKTAQETAYQLNELVSRADANIARLFSYSDTSENDRQFAIGFKHAAVNAATIWRRCSDYQSRKIIAAHIWHEQQKDFDKLNNEELEDSERSYYAGLWSGYAMAITIVEE